MWSQTVSCLVGAMIVAVGCTTAPPGAAAEGAWGPWGALEATTVTSLPECQRQGQTIDCWALSTGNTLVWLRGDGENWAVQRTLLGSVRAAPECVSRGNEIDCFAALVAGAGGGLGHIVYDGQNWTAGNPLGGSVKQKPACLAGPGQQITCVALAADDSGWWYYHFDGQA
jgi:hypothetical protein